MFCYGTIIVYNYENIVILTLSTYKLHLQTAAIPSSGATLDCWVT